jgi:serine/threonine protein kinase
MVERRLLHDGDTFAGYLVHRLAAVGSVTQVYEVEHSRTGRRFVLKCLDAIGATEAEKARFHNGLKALFGLRHEGLPAVLDGGLEDGKLWLAQELVVGRFVVKEDREPHWIKTCGWALPASQALLAAAEKGILHGDLSPESILLSEDGAAQILGAGGHNLYGFSAEVIRATPEFRSPEQRAGRPIDVRSDIYSFGLLVYASLAGTGRAPVEVRSFKEVPGCPRALAEIVAKCVQRDPEARFATWDELESLLRAVALHQILNPDALHFAVPSSGVRGLDEVKGSAPSGEEKPSSEDLRDTLASVPHESPLERGGSLDVIEGNPGELGARAGEVLQEEGAANDETGEPKVLEKGSPAGGALPTPRVVGSVAGRSGGKRGRSFRARRVVLALVGLVLVLMGVFFFAWKEDAARLLVAAPILVPRVVLSDASEEPVSAPPAPERAAPPPEVAPPAPASKPRRDQTPTVQEPLLIAQPPATTAAIGPEEPAVSAADVMLNEGCRSRCDP